MTTFVKDPGAILDYRFDWAALTNGTGTSDWLESGETISSFTVTVDAGLTKGVESLTDTNTSVTVWLHGGEVGKSYNVVCQITTSAGRTEERTAIINMKQR